jgi:hypothetical protein
MTAHVNKTIPVADKIIVMVNSALSALDHEIASWPADFRAIMWDTVADVASRRAEAARRS